VLKDFSESPKEA
jgi:hypothetical protein